MFTFLKAWAVQAWGYPFIPHEIKTIWPSVSGSLFHFSWLPLEAAAPRSPVWAGAAASKRDRRGCLLHSALLLFLLLLSPSLRLFPPLIICLLLCAFSTLHTFSPFSWYLFYHHHLFSVCPYGPHSVCSFHFLPSFVFLLWKWINPCLFIFLSRLRWSTIRGSLLSWWARSKIFYFPVNCLKSQNKFVKLAVASNPDVSKEDPWKIHTPLLSFWENCPSPCLLFGSFDV